MPTTTRTMTSQPPSSIIPLKGTQPSTGSMPATSALSPPASPLLPPSTTTAATLRSLYNRAARAFLHKDVALTQSLINDAFSFLKPPPLRPILSLESDPLASQRRKWDILRITFETTLALASPTAPIPEPLKQTLELPPHALVSSLYARSLELHTPSAHPHRANPAFLPPAIVLTLSLASLRLDAADVGRRIVEEWLARRGQWEGTLDAEGYEKVLEVYTLHILPRLEQWEYSKEFLEYEGELGHERREHMRYELAKLESSRSKTLSTLSCLPSPPNSNHATPGSSSPRAPSPSPSSSSSLSTTSTHTAVPAKRNELSGLASLAIGRRGSSSSLTSEKTVTRAQTNGHGRQHRSNSQVHGQHSNRSSFSNHSHSSARRVLSTLPRGAPLSISSRSTHPPPNIFSLLKEALVPYLGLPRFGTIVFLAIFLPLASFVLRLRRRDQLLAGGDRKRGVDNVRKRLAAVESVGGGVLAGIWGEAVRALMDTVKMAGRGLV